MKLHNENELIASGFFCDGKIIKRGCMASVQAFRKRGRAGLGRSVTRKNHDGKKLERGFSG